MNILSVCVVGVFAVLCSVALRKYSGEIASLMILSAVVMTALLALPAVSSVLESVGVFSETAGIGQQHIRVLIKAVGICFITQLSSDICRENGGQSAASQIELCGKLSILIIACPLYADLISLVTDFLK